MLLIFAPAKLYQNLGVISRERRFKGECIMSETSKYWYKKVDIPDNAKDKISRMVKGEKVAEFEIGGGKHQLLKTDGDVFRNLFIENRKYLYKGDYTAPPDENDYKDSTNYITDDGLAGFSITKTGWLVSLFSNYMVGGFAKAIKKYIIGYAYKLVCIVANTDEGNGLVEIYKNLYGFRKYVTTINDVDIMRQYYGDGFIDSFIENNGTPFHVFMIGEDAVGESEIKKFRDYFEAEAYVENTVRRR